MEEHARHKHAGHNGDTASDGTVGEPTLTIAVGARTALPGQRLTYRLSFKNTSSAPLDAHLQCTLPDALRYLSADDEGVFDPETSTLTWRLGVLLPGASGERELATEVISGPETARIITVRGCLESAGLEPVLAVAPVVQVEVPAVKVEMSVNTTEAGPGGVLLYTVTYACEGAAAGAARLSLQLPEHTTLVSATGGGFVQGGEGLVCWDTPPLTAGHGDTVLVTARVESTLPAGATVLRTDAMLEAPGLPSPVRSNPVRTEVAASPLLAASLRLPRFNASPGDRVPALLTITNTGNAPARDVRVVAPAPQHTRVLSLDGVPGAGGSLELATDVIDVGCTVTMQWTLELAEAFPRGATSVQPSAHLHVPLSSPVVIDGPQLVVEAEPRLAIGLELDHCDPRPGGTVVFLARYSNTGTAPAAEVAVGIPLPDYAVPVPELTTGTVDSARRQLIVRLGDLPVGADGEIRLGVRLDDEFPQGTTEITSRASAAAREIELIQTDPVAVLVKASPELTVVAGTEARTCTPGERVDVTLQVSNTGSAPGGSIVVTATLPPRVSVVSGSPGVTFDASAGELTWQAGAVRPGQDQQVSVKLALDDVFPVGDTAIAVPVHVAWDGGKAVGRPARITVVAAPRLELSIQALSATARPSDSVRYRIECANTGDAVAADARVLFRLDDAWIEALLCDLSGSLTFSPSSAFEIGDIAPGESTGFHVLARLASTFPAGETVLSADAIIEARGGGHVCTATAEHAVVRAYAAPSLELSVVVDRDRTQPGGSLAYKIECVNTGDAPASNLAIEAALPPGSTLLSASGAARFEPAEDDSRWGLAEAPGAGSVRWQADRLEPGAATSVGVVVSLADCYPAGETQLAMAVHAECAEPRTGVERTVNVVVGAAPKLALSVTLASTSAVPGDKVRVMMAAANLGNAVASGAVLAMRIPDRAHFKEASTGGRHDPASRLVTWELAPLPVTGTEQACWLDLRLAPTFAAGDTQIPVAATITCPQDSAEARSDGFTVLASPVAELGVEADRPDPLPGEPIIYTLTFDNVGDAAATHVELIDPVPPGMVFVSATHGGTYDADGDAVRWHFGAAPAGCRLEVMVTLRLESRFPLGTTEIGNQATASVDDSAAVESNEHLLEVHAAPELRLSVQGSASAATPGAEVVVTVMCEAGGHADACDVRPVLTLAPCMRPVLATEGGVIDREAGTIAWELADMSPGERLSSVVTCVLEPLMPAGDTTYAVRLEATSLDAPEPEPSEWTVHVEAAPELLLSLEFEDDSVSPGEEIELTASVANNGNAAAANVVVSIPLPYGFEPVEAESVVAADDSEEAPALTWDVGGLDGGGAGGTTRFLVTPRAVFPSGASRVAFSGAATSEGGIVSGCAPANVDVIAVPRLIAIGDVGPSTATVGDRLSYTFEVRNMGHVPLTNLEVTDNLPEGLRVVSAGGDAGVAQQAVDKAIWKMPLLPCGESFVVTLGVVPQPGFPPGVTTAVNHILIAADELDEPTDSGPVPVEVSAKVAMEGAIALDCESLMPASPLAATIAVVNTGTATAPEVVVTAYAEPLEADDHEAEPGGVEVVQLTHDGEVCEDGMLRWRLTELAPGEPVTLTALLRMGDSFPVGLTEMLLRGQVIAEDVIIEMSPSHLQVTAHPCIEVSSRVDADAAGPGDLVTFELSVLNSGTATAEGVVLEDVVPPRCVVEAIHGDGELDESAGTLRWRLDAVHPGDAPRVFSWTARLNPAFPAGVTQVGNGPLARGPDLIAVELGAGPVEPRVMCMPASVAVTSQSDIGADIQIEPPDVEPGDRVVCRLRLENAGAADTVVSLSAVVPDGLHALSPTSGECVVPAGSVDEWTVDFVAESALPAGTSILPICVTATTESGPALERKASVRARVVPVLGVRVDGVREGASVAPGDALPVELWCDVKGRADARHLVLRLELPSGCRLEEASDFGLATEEHGKRIVRWDCGEVAVGGSLHRTCTLRVPSIMTAGAHDIRLVASADADAADLVLSAPVTLTATADARLALEAEVAPARARVGDTVQARFVLRNSGNAPATAIRLGVLVPEGPVGSDEPTIWAAQEFTFDTLDPGDERTVEAPIVLEGQFRRGLTPLSVTGSLTCHETDYAHTVEARADVEALPRMSVTTSVDKVEAVAGDVLTYTVQVANGGDTAALKTLLTDQLPAHLTFLTASHGGALDEESGQIRWDLGVTADDANGAHLVTWQGRLATSGYPAGRWPIVNRPAVAADDDLPLAAERPARSVVDAEPVLKPTLQAIGADGSSLGTGAVEAGDYVSFAVQLANTGSALARPAIVSLALPPELLVADAAGAEYDHVEKCFVWTLEELPPGGHWSCAVEVEVAPVLASGRSGVVTELGARAVGAVDADVARTVALWGAPQVDLSIEADRTDVQPGDQLQLSVDYAVAGTAHAGELRIAVPIPDGLIVEQVLDGGVADEDTMTWTPGRSAVGDSGTLRCRMRVATDLGNGAVLQCRAGAHAVELEPTTASPIELCVRAAPELSLEMSVDRDSARPGEGLRYTLTVANKGLAMAAGVVLVNPLPPDCAIESATDGGAYDELADAVAWRLGTLGVGESRVVEWSLKLSTDFTAGETAFVNLAMAQSNDGEFEAESGEVTTNVVARAVLALDLALSDDRYEPGTTVPCQLAWSNSGDAVAGRTRLGMQLPDGVQSVWAEDGRELERVGTDVYLPIGAVHPNAEGSAVVQLVLESPFPRGVTALPIKATLSSDEAGSVSGHGALHVEAQPQLVALASVDQRAASPGNQLNYELTWANNGGAGVDGGLLSVALPSHVHFESAVPEAAVDATTNAVRWNLAELPAGASGTMKLAVRIDPRLEAGDTEIAIRPLLKAGDDLAFEAQPAVTVVRATPRLESGLRVEPAECEPGGAVTWSLTVQNVGDADARRVELVFPLPERTELISAGGGATRLDPATRTLYVTLGLLGVGERSEFDVTLRLESSFVAGVTEVQGRARFDAEGCEPVWTESATTVVHASITPQVAVVLDASSLAPGAALSAEVTLANDGTADAPDAGFAFTVPEGTELLDTLGGVLQPDLVTVLWPRGRLAAQARETLTILMRLAESFPAGTTPAQFVAALDTEAGEVTDDATVWVHAAPELTIAMSADVDRARPGQELQVELGISNVGNAPAESVRATLTLPPRCELIASGADAELDEAARQVSWPLETVGSEASVQRMVVVKLDDTFPAGTTTLTTVAGIRASNAPATEDAAVQVPVVAGPELALAVRANTQTPVTGGRIGWTLEAQNTGDAAATQTRIMVRPAAGTTLVEGPGGALSTRDAWVWDVADFDAGTETGIEVWLELDESFPAGESLISPEVSIVCNEQPRVPVEVPQLKVRAVSDLRVQVTSETSVAMAAVGTRIATRSGGEDQRVEEGEAQMMPVGANLTFTLTISNPGDAPATDAVVQHDLPPGSAFISVSDGGTYERSAHRVTWALGTVDAGTDGLIRTTVVRFGA